MLSDEAGVTNVTVASLLERMDELQASIDAGTLGSDRAWLLSNSVVILSMQMGFAMLEVRVWCVWGFKGTRCVSGCAELPPSCAGRRRGVAFADQHFGEELG
jgi:hypothetical protein